MSKSAPKRSASPTDAAADPEKKTESKKSKEEQSADFTGSHFSDDEGTSVYTDGACFFNGKKGQVAGVGVFWEKDDPSNASEVLPGTPSNHRAEIYAAVRAVQIAKTKGVKNLILHTDSQYLINGITKWIGGWKKRDWKTSSGEPVKNKEDFEALDEELSGISIKWVHAKSKSGNESCDEADRLAKKGAGLKEKEDKTNKKDKESKDE